MSSPSLESLITAHRDLLASLYTSLSPSPTQLVDAQLEAIHSSLDSLIAQQRSTVEDEVARVEGELASRWQKVTDWRVALGEPAGESKKKGDGPLLSLVEEVEQVIEGMSSRMQQRGELIVELQRRLQSFVEVLGREWLTVELEEFENGWEGLDLRLERMSGLERECLRCEAEIVSVLACPSWSPFRSCSALLGVADPPVAQAHRRDVLALHINEIFALRSELGIHQSASSSPDGSNAPKSRASLTGEVPLSDPLDEAILSHLGVGEEREKKEMIPTSENLSRVEAKRKWVS